MSSTLGAGLVFVTNSVFSKEITRPVFAACVLNVQFMSVLNPADDSESYIYQVRMVESANHSTSHRASV